MIAACPAQRRRAGERTRPVKDPTYWIDSSYDSPFVTPSNEFGPCRCKTLNTPCGPGNQSCECPKGDETYSKPNCYDAMGNLISFPLKIFKGKLDELIKLIGVKLTPTGKWIVSELKNSRRVSGMAKSKSGEKYAVIAEISGQVGAPKLKNFRIFHQQQATVMLQVAPGDVQ